MKIVCFANQKGGCGKSTLLVIFAAYLKKVLDKSVIVIDTDKQRTVFSFYEKEKNVFSNDPLYEVLYMNNVDAQDYFKGIKDDDTIYLIDTPNQLDEENFNLLKLADSVIVPYNYSNSSMSSTLTFLDVYKLIYEDDVKLIFIANAIKNTINTDSLAIFKGFLLKDLENGRVLDNDIKDTIKAQRVDILNVDKSLLIEFETPLKELADKIGIN